jgi:hypothetical protein
VDGDEFFRDIDGYVLSGFQHLEGVLITLVITHQNLRRFIEATGHAIRVVDVPGLEK